MSSLNAHSWRCLTNRCCITCRPEDSEIEVEHLKNGELAVLETIWGHIGGGGANDADTEWMDKKIAAFLKQGN